MVLCGVAASAELTHGTGERGLDAETCGLGAQPADPDTADRHVGRDYPGRSGCGRGCAGEACSEHECGERSQHGKGIQPCSRDFWRIPSDALRTVTSPVASGTWQLDPCEYGDVRALAAELSLDEVTASVLVRRGYGAPDAARHFLDGALPGHDPFALGDMRDAVETITAAVEAGGDRARRAAAPRVVH